MLLALLESLLSQLPGLAQPVPGMFLLALVAVLGVEASFFSLVFRRYSPARPWRQILRHSIITSPLGLLRREVLVQIAAGFARCSALGGWRWIVQGNFVGVAC